MFFLINMVKKQSRIIYTQPSEGYWDIPEVSYRGETHTYRLFEKMTPAIDRGSLGELYDKEKRKGNPHPADSILYFAIFSAVFEQRNKNPKVAEKLRNFLNRRLKNEKKNHFYNYSFFSPSSKL